MGDSIASSSVPDPAQPPPHKDVEVGSQAAGGGDGVPNLRQGLGTQIRRAAGDRDTDQMSPIYRAIFLAEADAANMIEASGYHQYWNCGPNGQNVLHVAALRSRDLTQRVLERWKGLRYEADGSGSTPLHYAASVGVKGVTSLLVEGDTFGFRKADSNGMCPIHIAASVGAMDAIRALVGGNGDESFSSAALRDAKGGTFLHVGVANKKESVVKFACSEARPPALPRSILNMKDHDGNTALHLAVKNRDESSFRHLVGNRYVDLNCVNNDGYTPLDLACKIRIENSFASRQNPTEWMIRVLAHSGAYLSARRRDLKFCTTQKNQVPLALTTESVLVASALIATVTFAAAFTMPGSYKIGGNPKAGTPELGSRYGFKVFLVADILAFYCSVAATFSLAEYGSRGNVDPLVRHTYAKRAIWFFHVALKSVIVAFALGVSVVMWDVSVSATVIAAIAAFVTVLYGNEELAHDLRLVRVMCSRFGLLRSAGTLHPSTSSHLDWNTWWLRSFYVTLVWNIVKLYRTYGIIFLVAYIAQLKQKDGN